MALAIATMMTFLGAGTAGAAPRSGLFLCQSSVFRLADEVWLQANPPETPCADDLEATDRQDLTFLGTYRLQSSVIDARTDQKPNILTSAAPAAGDLANSSARLASIRVTGPGLLIEFGAVHADAAVTCVPGGDGLVPSFSARSTIVTLKVNGTTVVDLTGPITIPLSVGTLRLNQTTTTATALVRRAAVWDTPFVDLILGEARVSIAPSDGNPCRA
ncbi:choice-of-anchor P family protein [Amycolatopsis japonica]|uniref:choice-of-anchor P family protein n=1 Tax=Amycolatopsis japonica TaxID=208439 RepID=UPI00366D365B